jgi:stress response protein YsnF
MASDINSPDVPFPGAHSQVTGKPRDDTPGAPARAAASSLPLQASAPTRDHSGWVVRLPVRAEHVNVEKRIVVYEQVRIERHADHDFSQQTAEIRREELRVRDTSNG